MAFVIHLTNTFVCILNGRRIGNGLME